jgi:hypothetical protein
MELPGVAQWVSQSAGMVGYFRPIPIHWRRRTDTAAMNEQRLASEADGYNLMTMSRGRARPDSGEGTQWDTRTCALGRSALELVTMTNWFEPSARSAPCKPFGAKRYVTAQT